MVDLHTDRRSFLIHFSCLNFAFHCATRDRSSDYPSDIAEHLINIHASADDGAFGLGALLAPESQTLTNHYL